MGHEQRDELDAVAERIVDEAARETGEVDVATRLAAGFGELGEQQLERRDVAQRERGVGLRRRRERLAHADVQLLAPHANQQPPRPASASGFAISGRPSRPP